MRILVADDDPFIRRIVELALTKWGYEVMSVPDGNEALRLLSQDDGPRLAILDWMMPGIDGLEVIREVRRWDRQSYVYIVMLTGRSEARDIETGLETGADDYITKPLDLMELKARISCAQRVIQLQSEVIASQSGR
ncbi:MAG: response regulator [Desulfomonile tiedjei]|uniref:Response regulator n=1 Tax=Desulfomonile tiedjei TaxID=2358 RepID=A0A9D6Z499_9BACT|nr:response regulator [Desulfomonile tiedjei]